MERAGARLVIGLGNPGEEYEDTRHNVGFHVVNVVAKRHGVVFRRSWRSHALIAKLRLSGKEVRLVKPLVYMNRSGVCVRALVKKYGLLPEHVLVVFDDVELPCGEVRIRKQGGAGGHQGMESVIAHLGTREFPRIRVGVGPRPPGDALVDYVLGVFKREEMEKVTAAIEHAAYAVERIVAVGVDRAMNEFNRKKE